MSPPPPSPPPTHTRFPLNTPPCVRRPSESEKTVRSAGGGTGSHAGRRGCRSGRVGGRESEGGEEQRVGGQFEPWRPGSARRSLARSLARSDQHSTGRRRQARRRPGPLRLPCTPRSLTHTQGTFMDALKVTRKAMRASMCVCIRADMNAYLFTYICA